MDQEKELEYIKQIVDGDTHLYAYFLQHYSNSIFSMVRQMIGNNEDAEEITQDVFLKAFRKIHTFKGNSKFSSWLYRIAYNTTISATRKAKKEYAGVDDFVLNNISDEDVDEFLNKENDEVLLLELEQAIKCLSIEDKSLIVLYYQQEKPIKELADIMNLSESNIKVKLHRVRKKLYSFINNSKHERG